MTPSTTSLANLVDQLLVDRIGETQDLALEAAR
jgi:hypothetical protein